MLAKRTFKTKLLKLPPIPRSAGGSRLSPKKTHKRVHTARRGRILKKVTKLLKKRRCSSKGSRKASKSRHRREYDKFVVEEITNQINKRLLIKCPVKIGPKTAKMRLSIRLGAGNKTTKETTDTSSYEYDLRKKSRGSVYLDHSVRFNEDYSRSYDCFLYEHEVLFMHNFSV